MNEVIATLLVAFAYLNFNAVFSLPQRTWPSCGYQSCPLPKEGYLNLHLVPHTHDDVGWLKTYDQYYYGNNMSIQDAGVQYILDSVVQELMHDYNKRFIYVETAFFWKWWMEQTDTIRHQVKKLVNRGQLEFVGGAWSMHDEACTHYQSMLDQTTWGFRKLMDTFGECGRPRVGWQIDPFGHSRENAKLMAHYGFDGLFLGRIDWEDKSYRVHNREMEIIWQTSANDDSDASKLFTGVLYNTYSSPKGFCFDINCHDEPIVDNKRSPMYNAEQRAKDFMKQMLIYAEAYKTNNILVTMGDDFMYMNAHMNYKNMDKLIHQLNLIEMNGVKANAFYSTPSCYLKAVHGTGVSLPKKSDDFMPYSSDPHAFWSGYFSSRPTIKNYERIGNNFLQVCKQLSTIGEVGNTPGLSALREAMGVMQHHDAVTGTEKQHVASDYSRILTDAIHQCHQVTTSSLRKLMGDDDNTLVLESCLLNNISSCALTENSESFVVTVYNPLSRSVNFLVKAPVHEATDFFTVFNPKGKKVAAQVIKIPQAILNIPGRDSKAKAHLMFIAEDLPPLGFRSYFVTKNHQQSKSTKEATLQGQPIRIGFKDGAMLKLNEEGIMSHLKIGDKEISITSSLFYYKAALGNNQIFENRSSGAYIFRPLPNEHPVPIPLDGKPIDVKLFKGPVVQEAHLTYSDWTSQIIRIHKGANYVDIQWVVGPIPIEDGVGKEVVTEFVSDEIDNKKEFLTDSNGREYLMRKINFRPSWPVQLVEPISGNYYPVVTTISIEGGDSRLSVVTDRSQGGSSLKKGSVELMVHRRLLHDDAFGVGEALNETAYGAGLVATGSHFVTTANLAETRKLVQEKILNSWTFFSAANHLSFEDWQKKYTMEVSAMKSALPDNVQILTLEPWIGKSVLLRLEHIMESLDDPVLSKPVTVNLRGLFDGFTVITAEELMLGANIKVSESKRFVWNEDTPQYDTMEAPFSSRESKHLHNLTITLNPMEIKTFVIHFKR